MTATRSSEVVESRGSHRTFGIKQALPTLSPLDARPGRSRAPSSKMGEDKYIAVPTVPSGSASLPSRWR